MKTRYLNIGDDAWGLLLCTEYSSKDYEEMYAIMENFGLSEQEIDQSFEVLSKQNTGMTVTDFSHMMSVVFISKAVSDDQWLDTLFHELKHVVEHISLFYKVSSQSESSAYLQGEIGRQLFPVIMSRFCKSYKSPFN